MAAVNVTFDGLLYDLWAKTTQRVVLIGQSSLTGLGVGGGPVYPPVMPGPPGHPEFPIWGPPGIDLPPGPGYPPVAGHPLPPIPPIPPDTVVPPGTVVVPPGQQPVQPIVPPPFIRVYYPGVGWVLVGQPVPPAK